MNLQAIINQMNENEMLTRSNYHLTLGGLNDALSSAPDDALVAFDDGTPAGRFGSYRGYYSDIAISDGLEAETVKQWRVKTAQALDTVFYGYKGGEYPASPKKPLWRSENGEASQVAIVGIVIADNVFTLVTKRVEE